MRQDGACLELVSREPTPGGQGCIRIQVSRTHRGGPRVEEQGALQGSMGGGERCKTLGPGLFWKPHFRGKFSVTFQIIQKQV